MTTSSQINSKEKSSLQLDMLLEEFENRLHMEKYTQRFQKWLDRQDDVSEEQTSKKLIQMALENVDIDAPDWTFVAAAELLHLCTGMHKHNRGYSGTEYGSFYDLLITVL